jgi:HD-GYP domain-containing protein (c-di-GMP phosphodiesterase class II)
MRSGLMAVAEQRMALAELRSGMYVCRLDRPWEGTPFPLQGFRVGSAEDIEALSRFTREVVIDIERSIPLDGRSALERLGYFDHRPGARKLPPVEHYPVEHDVKVELPLAAQALAVSHERAGRVLEQFSRGETVMAEELRAAVEPVVASVIRNPDAWFWLSALRRRDDYSYTHALNVCALAAALGRQLGMPRLLLHELGQAGLLLDVGMTAVPDELLQHAGPLTPAQREQVQQHVAHGLRLLSEQDSVDEDVLEMIAHHHERHDGSGYPRGLRQSAIPLFSRMLGLVDSYDAICSERPYHAALPPHEALQILYRESGRLFQEDLVEQLSQCLGVYPTGSMVELTTGEVAIVMAQNPSRRLFPRVTVLTRPDKQIDPAFRQVDLWAEREQRDGEVRRVWVLRPLALGSYGIDARHYFLV